MMEQVEGYTLGVYLDHNSSKPRALHTLRQGFADLADFLERNGVSHGDIRNDNVIISGGAIRLIDYDGMFVTGMTEGRGSEVGHKTFQHPERATKHFGPKMERLSFIVIDVSLEAIETDSALHLKFREGGNSIIFKADDFSALLGIEWAILGGGRGGKACG